MDPRLQSIVENLDKYEIGLDDVFSFKCRCCGKCCKNRDDLLLNPHDVFRIAKHFEKNPIEIISEYCEVYIGETSRIPIVRLIPRGNYRACPFLQDKRCSIQDDKPTVCSLYPVGRMVKSSNEHESREHVLNTGYIIQPIDCGSQKKSHTVRQWLEKCNIPIEDKFYIEWNKLITELFNITNEIEKTVSSQNLEPFFSILMNLFYLKYDIGMSFISQFVSNKKEALELASSLRDELNNSANVMEGV